MHSGSRTCRSSGRSSSARRGSSMRRGSASSPSGYYLSRTRPGLNVRAVGESPAAADAMGISVTRYRYLHTLAGGAFAGVGGACFSLALTPQWVDGLTGGRRLDRDRARHLRLLARRPLPRRRLRLRRVLGAAVHAAGARCDDRAAAVPGAAVRDDYRRARDRLLRHRPSAGSAPPAASACPTCARSGSRAWTS